MIKMKYYLKICLLLLLFFSLSMLVLILSREYLLNYIIQYIKEKRQTTQLVGEDKSIEFFFIMTRFVMPIVLFLNVVLIFLLVKRRNTGIEKLF